MIDLREEVKTWHATNMVQMLQLDERLDEVEDHLKICKPEEVLKSITELQKLHPRGER
jgi:hypothetical protein